MIDKTRKVLLLWSGGGLLLAALIVSYLTTREQINPTAVSSARAMETRSLSDNVETDVFAKPATPTSNLDQQMMPGQNPTEDGSGLLPSRLASNELAAPSSPSSSPSANNQPTSSGGSVQEISESARDLEPNVRVNQAFNEGNSELVIPVPPGARIPAVFYDEEPKPAPQQRALDRIVREFNEAVEQAAASPLDSGGPGGGIPSPAETAASREVNSELRLQEIWGRAAARADRQYINLYGFAAWHELHISGAREAAREKRALQTP